MLHPALKQSSGSRTHSLHRDVVDAPSLRTKGQVGQGSEHLVEL